MTTAMKRTRITPNSEDHWLDLRTEDLTSTDIAALFGCSPYLTHFEVWHRKKNQDRGDFKSNDRIAWGLRLEDAIARGIAQDMNIEVRRLNLYTRLEGMRMGSSFDFEIINHADGPGILEIKNVDGLVFRDGWIVEDDGKIEAPPHIELQLQHQMLVSGRTWAMIGALVGGNRVVQIHRKYDEEIGSRIIEVAEKFWLSIDAGQAPEPDYARDVKTIQKLYDHAEPGKVLDASSDENIATLMMEYGAAGLAEKEAKARKDAAKGELLTLIGEHEKVLTPIGSITAGVVGASEVAYIREPYRNFRVNLKKEAKQSLAAAVA